MKGKVGRGDWETTAHLLPKEKKKRSQNLYMFTFLYEISSVSLFLFFQEQRVLTMQIDACSSCLFQVCLSKNSMDRGEAWQAEVHGITVHGITKRRTRLNNESHIGVNNIQY